MVNTELIWQKAAASVAAPVNLAAHNLERLDSALVTSIKPLIVADNSNLQPGRIKIHVQEIVMSVARINVFRSNMGLSSGIEWVGKLHVSGANDRFDLSM